MNGIVKPLYFCSLSKDESYANTRKQRRPEEIKRKLHVEELEIKICIQPSRNYSSEGQNTRLYAIFICMRFRLLL